MSEATRLTQGGELHAATAAIQAALPGRPLDAAAPATLPHQQPLGREPRRIGHRCRAREPATRRRPGIADRSAAGQFIAGSHSEAGRTRDYKLFMPPGGTAGRYRWS